MSLPPTNSTSKIHTASTHTTVTGHPQPGKPIDTAITGIAPAILQSQPTSAVTPTHIGRTIAVAKESKGLLRRILDAITAAFASLACLLPWKKHEAKMAQGGPGAAGPAVDAIPPTKTDPLVETATTVATLGETISPQTAQIEKERLEAERKARVEDELRKLIEPLKDIPPGMFETPTTALKLPTFKDLLTSVQHEREAITASPPVPNTVTETPLAIKPPDPLPVLPTTPSAPATPVALPPVAPLVEQTTSKEPLLTKPAPPPIAELVTNASPLLGRVGQVQIDKAKPEFLLNIGNTCYMNSCIQVIEALDPLMESLKQPIVRPPLSSKQEAAIWQHSQEALQPYLEAIESKKEEKDLKPLLRKLHDEVVKATPEVVINLVPTLEAMVRSNAAITVKDQTDLCKALRDFEKEVENRKDEYFLREEIRKALIELIDAQKKGQSTGWLAVNLRRKLFNSPGVTCFQDVTEERLQQDAAAFIETILSHVVHLQHEIQVKKTVRQDNRVITRLLPLNETQSSIPIVFPQHAVPYLQQMFNDYFHAKVTDKEGWKNLDQNPREGEVGIVGPKEIFKEWEEDRTLIRDLNGVLSLQINRFDYDSEKKEYFKLNTPLEFPPNNVLDISAACGAPSKTIEADLVGFVVHTGGKTVHGGHYYSYVKKGGQWYKCDDQESSILPQTQTQIDSAKKEAYLVFFGRK